MSSKLGARRIQLAVLIIFAFATLGCANKNAPSASEIAAKMEAERIAFEQSPEGLAQKAAREQAEAEAMWVAEEAEKARELTVIYGVRLLYNGNGIFTIFRVQEDGVTLSPILIRNYYPGSIILKQDANSDEPIRVDLIGRHDARYFGPTYWDRIEIHIHSVEEIAGGSWRHKASGKSNRMIEEMWKVVE